MDLSTAFPTCALLSLMLFLSFLLYRKVLKKIEGFPFLHLPLNVVYEEFTGKIPKHVPFNAYIFQVALDACKRKYDEGMFMMYLTRPILVIFSEEAMKFFIRNKAASEKSPDYDQFADFIGASMITCNGERYKFHKKMVNPSFHMGILKDKVPLFNEHALRLVKEMEKLAGKPSEEVLDVLKRNYFSGLTESIFGLKQDEEGRREILKLASNVDSLSDLTVKRMICLWLRPRFLLPFTRSGREFQKRQKVYHNYITSVIKDMKKLVTSNKTENSSVKRDATSDRFNNCLQKSFTYILLNQHLNDPSSFTLQDVNDVVNTILFAGYDTVSYTTLWCLFLLGLHPEVQEKAFEEVQSTCNEDITYEDICNLEYLEAVIMETLRLYPTVPFISRNLSEDVQFGKYKVHKDTTITFAPYLTHRNPEIFPDPEKYEPERFLVKDSRRTGIFFPFAEGNRTCIGKQFAMIEMKIFLAHLLRNFRFVSLDNREDILLCWNVILSPSRRIRMKITSRRAEEKLLSNGKE